MKWDWKNLLSLFLLLLSLGAIGILVSLEKKVLPPLAIVGSIFDVTNRPLGGIPWMLYAEKEEECLYTAISNAAGKFRIPKPQPGVYHLKTLIDKERSSLQPFRILPESSAIEIKIIYAGTTESQKTATEPLVIAKPHLPESTPPSSSKVEEAVGSIQGQVFINSQLQESGNFTLVGMHLENTHYKPTYQVSVIESFYQISNLPVGPYRFTATMPGLTSIQGLEIYILANQQSKLDLSFEQEVIHKKSGTDISITVIDSSWTPQSQAQVILSASDGSYQKEGETDENGEKIFQDVPPGDYQVKATFNGVRGRCELEEQVTAVEGKFTSIVLRETE